MVNAHPMVPVVPNGTGRTGSSSSFPITHMHHVDPSMQSPASSNSYIPQHIHYMGSHPRVVGMPQELHSSHSGLGMSSQPEALCTTQSWDALRENSLPRSTASSDRYSRDRTGFVHGVKTHYIDYPQVLTKIYRMILQKKTNCCVNHKELQDKGALHIFPLW